MLLCIMEISYLLTRYFTGTTLTTRHFFSRASASVNETQEITEGCPPGEQCVGWGVPLCARCVSKNRLNWGEGVDRAREKAATRRLFSPLRQEMETALSGQEAPGRWSCWLHPACSGRRVECEKAPPSLLQSPCAATARVVSLPLTSALEVGALQAVLGTHTGGCHAAGSAPWHWVPHEGGLHPLHSPAKPLLLCTQPRRRSRSSAGRFLSLRAKLFLKGTSLLTSGSPGFSSAFLLGVQRALCFCRAIPALCPTRNTNCGSTQGFAAAQASPKLGHSKNIHLQRAQG